MLVVPEIKVSDGSCSQLLCHLSYQPAHADQAGLEPATH